MAFREYLSDRFFRGVPADGGGVAVAAVSFFLHREVSYVHFFLSKGVHAS